jgi:outer membrane protein, multidrug efflux system
MKKHILILLSLGAAGCSFIPHYNTPQTEVPAQWSQETSADNAAIAQNWWTSFGSKELDNIMAEALANNNDIRASLQRIEQSRAILRISGAELLPTADATAGISRDRATRPDSNDTNLNAGAGITYELDLFGLNRANVQQAKAEMWATEFDHEALKLIVMGDVAQTYFNVLNARERLRIADNNLKNSREVLRIVNARFEAGASDALEVAQQKTELASTEAARALVVRDISTFENALAVLIGKTPQSIPVAGENLKSLNIPVVAAGQPSELLQRRPDIQSAESSLIAANADIGAARAAMFPSITIGLDASLASTGFGDPASTGLSLASNLLQPIFYGGRLEATVDQRTALREELIENYRKIVLVSFREVEDALANVKSAQTRETALNTAMQEARRSYELSRSRYDAGTIDFQTLLDAQRTLLSAEDAFAQSKNERLAAAVTLFRALGGGWSSEAHQKRDITPMTGYTPAATQETPPTQ